MTLTDYDRACAQRLVDIAPPLTRKQIDCLATIVAPAWRAYRHALVDSYTTDDSHPEAA